MGAKKTGVLPKASDYRPSGSIVNFGVVAIYLSICIDITICDRLGKIPMQNNYDSEDQAIYDALTSGISVSFQMEGITALVLECVDGYAIEGTATVEKGES